MRHPDYSTPIQEVSPKFIEAIPELPPPYASRDTEEIGNLPFVYVLNADSFDFKHIADEGWNAAKSNPANWLKIYTTEVEEINTQKSEIEENLRRGVANITLKSVDDRGNTIRQDNQIHYWIPPLDPDYWPEVVRGLEEIIDPM